MLNSIIAFLKRWNELSLLLLALMLWPFVPYLLRILDPTAAAFDAGVLHPIYITTLAFGALHIFVWMGIKLNFAGIWDFYQNDFMFHFNQLPSWQKIYISFSFFALYLFAVVLTFLAVAGMA